MDTPSPTTVVVDLEALAGLSKIVLIDVPTLCKAWKVTKDWVYDMVEKGGLPHTKLGPRTLRFSVTELEAWMAGKTETREAA